MEKYQRILTLEDVEAIVELDEIAARIEKGAKALIEKDWFDIQGRFFLKPTFAREQLIQKIHVKYPSGKFDMIGILYALDASRKEEELRQPPSVIKLLKYASKLDIDIAKARSVLEEVLGISDDDLNKDSSSKDKGEVLDPWYICSCLAREIGGSPDEWYNASPQKLKSAILAHEQKIDAEEAAMGGKKGPPKETPKLLTIVEFRKKINALELKWQAE